MRPIISIIAAVGENNAIGYKNKLPWHIPEDLKRFKKITSGAPVIMGYNTFLSLGKPLTGRANIVLMHERAIKIKSCQAAQSIKQAIDIARRYKPKEIFFIGGAQVYKQAMQLADKLYITKVKGSFKADAFFPDYENFGNVKKVGGGQYGKYEYEFIICNKN